MFNELQFFNNINKWPEISGGSSYFQNMTSLLEITFPCTLDKRLDRAMLQGCTALKRVIIMEGTTSIGGQFFYNCTSLQYIELPSTLTTFRGFSGSTYNTFYKVPAGCSVIVKPTTPPSAPSNNVFNQSNCIFYVPNNSVDAYKATTGWSSIAARIFPLSEYEE